MKFPRIISIILLALLIVSLSVSTEAYFMVIDVIQKKAGSVFFPHHRHLATPEDGGVAIACSRCHHEQRKPSGKTKTPVECTTPQCHPKDKESAAKTGILYIKDAFHGLCRKCHKASQKTYSKAPTKCKGCHKKLLIPFTKQRREKTAQ